MKAAFKLAPPLQQVDRTYVLWRGEKLSYFGGCDYFRLSSHPRIIARIREGLRQHGLSVSASRVTTGNHPMYEELESQIAKFFRAPKAVFVPTGYIANLVLAEALAGEFETAYIDEKAHPSLQSAVRLLGCRVIPFPHLNFRGRPSRRAIIATEGMFGQNGAVPPIADYLKSGAHVWVDDAHGAGVREPQPLPRRMIQTITFSKAFGVYGGAILGPTALARKVFGTKIFAGQTPLPLALAFACVEAMDLLRPGSALRTRLWKNVERVESAGPIIQIPGSKALKDKLLGTKIFPSWIRYPGGPPGGCFRFAISSEHAEEQLAALATSIAGHEE